MSPRLVAGLLTALLLAATAGCADDEPLSQPVVPSPTAVSSLSPSPSPLPSPSPSPTPLSPFEDDPAVQGLRTYLAAASAALNAKDLRLPALTAAATERRAALHPDLYATDLGPHYPGPLPVKVLGVRAVSATEKRILGCFVQTGFGLTAPGGTPAQPLEILPAETEMRLEGRTWKVHSIVGAEGISCAGLTLEDFV